LSRGRLCTEIVNCRDLALIATILTLKKIFYEGCIDFIEDILDGFVLDLCVLNSDRTLENADAPRVLIKDGIDILSSPERVLQN
jgi:hypothetical protein